MVHSTGKRLNRFTNKAKGRIVSRALAGEPKKALAREFQTSARQIRRWIETEARINAADVTNGTSVMHEKRNKYTYHAGTPPKHEEPLTACMAFLEKRKGDGYAVRVTDLVKEYVKWELAHGVEIPPGVYANHELTVRNRIDRWRTRNRIRLHRK